MQQPLGKPAVFLDRDGTLIDEMEFLVDPDRLRLIPGAAAAVRRLNQAQLPVVIISNQSMIARGLASERQLGLVHERLTAALAAEGAHLDGIYYCPHHPDIGEPPYRASCDCRKPLPGLLYQAAHDLDLDLEQSTMIGDSLRDLEAGAAAGCRTLILVRTGHGTAQEAMTMTARLEPSPLICDDLASAVDHLLSNGSANRTSANQSATPHPAAPQPVKSGVRPA